MINVLVCYENVGWQKGIQSVLQRQGSISAAYVDLRHKSARLPGRRFDVILVQAAGEQSGLRRNLVDLRRQYPSSRFVLMLENLGVMDLTFGHQMGMTAFVDERATAEQIVGSLEAAARGDLYASSSVIKRSLGQPTVAPTRIQSPAVAHELSQREVEVLGLVARGMSNRLIAKNLFISEKTVKNHLYSIFRKIGVTDRTKAALFAIKSLETQKDGPFGPGEMFFQVDEHE